MYSYTDCYSLYSVTMEAGVQVTAKTPTTPGGLSLQGGPDRSQVMSPSRLAKLPPISSPSGNGGHQTAASLHLQAASSELQDTMKLLWEEVCLVTRHLNLYMHTGLSL